MARVQIFLSTVSAEFRSYRDALRHDLTRPNVSVAVQEDFIVTGTETLDMLDDYIQQCDAVIHLVGDMTGALAQAPSLTVIRSRYPDLGAKLPPLAPSCSLTRQRFPTPSGRRGSRCTTASRSSSPRPRTARRGTRATS